MHEIAKSNPIWRDVLEKVETVISNCGRELKTNKEVIQDMICYSMANNLKIEKCDPVYKGACAVCGFNRPMTFIAYGEDNKYPMGYFCYRKIYALNYLFSLISKLSKEDHMGDEDCQMINRALDSVVKSGKPRNRSNKRRKIE